MDIYTHINPTFVEYEGFYYLEFEGDFYKGCKRCGGEGQYSHNGDHSRCYDCDNTSAKLGEQLASKQAAEKWCHERAVRKAQRERKAEAKRQAILAKRDAKQAALKASDPDVYEFLMNVDLGPVYTDFASYDEYAVAEANWSTLEKDSFVRAMAEHLRHAAEAEKPFTANMVAAVRKVAERRAGQAAESAAHPAPSGRVVVTGTITSAKMVDSDYGTAYKILVTDDAGHKVWCSLPKAQADEAMGDFYEAVEANGHSIYDFGSGVWFLGTEGEQYNGIKGRRITFTATLEPSKDDVAFAFGSRPSKGAWL